MNKFLMALGMLGMSGILQGAAATSCNRSTFDGAVVVPTNLLDAVRSQASARFSEKQQRRVTVQLQQEMEVLQQQADHVLVAVADCAAAKIEAVCKENKALKAENEALRAQQGALEDELTLARSADYPVQIQEQLKQKMLVCDEQFRQQMIAYKKATKERARYKLICYSLLSFLAGGALAGLLVPYYS
ncbi:MAG TPA: hypothetical protein VLG71_00540 [Candidatus Limnocylindria bacterium]|nr:hypothetical protein [Candidatus Limnocylindria bacterium]